jgi:hypothetical protein
MAHLDTNKVRSSQHQQNQTEILEYGDIYFFYRPKVRSEKVKSIEDVRRFFMITASEQRANNSNSDNQIYRLFVVGKKSLPTIRKSEARASERFWARIGGVFKNANELTKELLSDEFRRGDAARPVGEGKYALVKYQNHAEIAYILELPKEPGEAQKELGIEKEASYIISVNKGYEIDRLQKCADNSYWRKRRKRRNKERHWNRNRSKRRGGWSDPATAVFRYI